MWDILKIFLMLPLWAELIILLLVYVVSGFVVFTLFGAMVKVRSIIIDPNLPAPRWWHAVPTTSDSRILVWVLGGFVVAVVGGMALLVGWDALNGHSTFG